MTISNNVTVLGTVEIQFSFRRESEASAFASKVNAVFASNAQPIRVALDHMLDVYVWGPAPSETECLALQEAFKSHLGVIPTLNVTAVASDNRFALVFMSQGLSNSALVNAGIPISALQAKQGVNTEASPFDAEQVYITPVVSV